MMTMMMEALFDVCLTIHPAPQNGGLLRSSFPQPHAFVPPMAHCCRFVIRQVVVPRIREFDLMYMNYFQWMDRSGKVCIAQTNDGLVMITCMQFLQLNHLYY